MNKLDWVKSSLHAVVAALSTAPPESWVDGRVLAVASTTFLLNTLQAIGAGRETGSREELASALEEGFAEHQDQLQELAGKARVGAEDLARLRGTLIEELTELALRVEAWGFRVEELDQDVGLILERLAQVEAAVADQPAATELGDLRDQVVYELSLFESNALQDRLNELPLSQLHVVIRQVGLDRDNLRGETKEEKAGELVAECRRLRILGRLAEKLEERFRSPM